MLEGMAKKGCIVWPGVCIEVYVCLKEKKKEQDMKIERIRQWELDSRKMTVTDLSVRHAALQASGWWLIQHDDEPWYINTGPSSRLGLLSLELSEGRGNSPRLWVDTEPRWREDTWGICLFISSHMLYPLQCYSESAQWGIRWMLHQLSEDGRVFLPQEQLAQTSSIESGHWEGFGWEQTLFWHVTSGQWTWPWQSSFYLLSSALSTPQRLNEQKNRSNTVWLYMKHFQKDR